jgi:hypothetical protein
VLWECRTCCAAWSALRPPRPYRSKPGAELGRPSAGGTPAATDNAQPTTCNGQRAADHSNQSQRARPAGRCAPATLSHPCVDAGAAYCAWTRAQRIVRGRGRSVLCVGAGACRRSWRRVRGRFRACAAMGWGCGGGRKVVARSVSLCVCRGKGTRNGGEVLGPLGRHLAQRVQREDRAARAADHLGAAGNPRAAVRAVGVGVARSGRTAAYRPLAVSRRLHVVRGVFRMQHNR